MLVFLDNLEHPDDHPLIFLPSSTQRGPRNNGFTLFAQAPQEIRDHIWDICVRDYPARLIDLREYRRPASGAVSIGIYLLLILSRAPAPATFEIEKIQTTREM